MNEKKLSPPQERRRPNPARLLMALVALVLLATSAPADFLAQRRRFREEIKNKIETKLDAKGNFLSVIFKGEEGKYNFGVTPEDRVRLKEHVRSFFGTSEESLLEKMVDELNTGHYVIFKEYKEEGVVLKVIFLSPQAKYWEWLTDGNGIEKMFHTYNFSVGLGSPAPEAEIVILQTEGTFLGVTQAVSLPIRFEKNFPGRQYRWRMPTQNELLSWVEQMPPLIPGRTKPEEKFIDACRTHPFFQQKKGDQYLITDEDIIKLYQTTVANVEKDCPVKSNEGAWNIHEDYPYLVVDYHFTTRVNIYALIPESLRFLAGTLEDLAQSITDEVSVKYLPLSMKNFRDFTQEWTAKGGPP